MVGSPQVMQPVLLADWHQCSGLSDLNWKPRCFTAWNSLMGRRKRMLFVYPRLPHPPLCLVLRYQVPGGEIRGRDREQLKSRTQTRAVGGGPKAGAEGQASSGEHGRRS